jgi:hypothetical protein
MPRKEFEAFTRLDASDVNTFLMDQSVMSFAGTAARGSAITTPVEGMVTYLEDSNSLQLYNGSDWTSAGGVSSGNAIINGAFEINQRGYATGSTVASGVYTFDRWKATAADTTLSFTSAPQGQLVTINEDKSIEQVIERANLIAGTYTLSWSGTATGRVYNSGATPPSYAASPITVTLDGLENVEVEFTASGGTKTCGFVQLEAGPVATPFRRNANSLQGELAACQRYYVRFNQSAKSGLRITGTGILTGTNTGNFFPVFPVFMRTAPTSVDTAGTFELSNGYSFGLPLSTVTLFGASGDDQYGVGLNIVTTGTGLTQGQAGFLITTNTSARIGFSAEL